MKTRKIGLANYLAYGSGDFLGAGTTALTAAWLLYFTPPSAGYRPLRRRSFRHRARARRGRQPADGLNR